jgi:hypothetical protein
MEMNLPQQLDRQDLDRMSRYRENLGFYNGVQWAGSSRRRERRLTFNYARALIDKVAAYLTGDVHMSVLPLDDTQEARERARKAELALRVVSESNDLMQLDFDTEVDAAILGDGCFKVTWDTEGGRVRISAPDVQGLYAWWRGDDPNQVWRVASRYSLTSEEAEEIYGVQSAEAGLSGQQDATVVEVWTAGTLELWVQGELLDARANPYGFIPFVVFPNLREPKRFWGVSDIPPLMEPARELNRALSQLSTILELSGNPIAVLENVEQAEDIAVSPGAVWELPERAKAYLLDLLQGGGVKLHVDYVDLVYRALHDLSETPRISFGDNPRSLSGVALEMEMHPLLQKVRRKRLIRSAAYRRRAEMVLKILEQRTGERYLPSRIQVVWGSILPQDRSRQVRDEKLLVEAGLSSKRRAMAELGIENPEGELERWLEERGVMENRVSENGIGIVSSIVKD